MPGEYSLVAETLSRIEVEEAEIERLKAKIANRENNIAVLRKKLADENPPMTEENTTDQTIKED